MAIPEINDLFDQATDHAIELRTQVKEACSELEDALAAAEKASKVIVKESLEVEGAIERLVQRLDEVEAAVEEARSDADQALDAIETASQEAADAAKEMGEDVEEGLERLQGQIDGASADAGTRFQQFGTKAHEVNQAVAETGAAMGAAKAEADQAVADFQKGIEESNGAIEQAGQTMAAALAEAVGEMARSGDSWTEELGELLTFQTRGLVAAANETIRAHNDAMKELTERMGDGVRTAAGPPVDGLLQALDELETIASSHRDVLTGEVAELLEWITGTFRPAIAALSTRMLANQRLE